MKTLTISRRRWLNGKTKGDGNSLLYRSGDKKMCCLGFLARQCGAKVRDIIDVDMPKPGDRIAWPKALLTEGYGVTDLCNSLVQANDWECITQRERESRIKKGMLKAGIKVRFVP